MAVAPRPNAHAACQSNAVTPPSSDQIEGASIRQALRGAAAKREPDVMLGHGRGGTAPKARAPQAGVSPLQSGSL